MQTNVPKIRSILLTNICSEHIIDTEQMFRILVPARRNTFMSAEEGRRNTMMEYGINLKEDMILENRRSLARALRSRQRRIRQLRRRGSILVLCLLLSFLFLTGFRHKSPVILPAGGEIYTPVRVERGDTLWDLAGVYMPEQGYKSIPDYIRSVCRLNEMHTARIYEGQILFFPVRDGNSFR